MSQHPGVGDEPALVCYGRVKAVRVYGAEGLFTILAEPYGRINFKGFLGYGSLAKSAGAIQVHLETLQCAAKILETRITLEGKKCIDLMQRYLPLCYLFFRPGKIVVAF